jgi:hypothetical protein
MKSKSSLALLYLMSFGFATTVQSSQADELQVKIFEQDLKKYVAEHGQIALDYPQRLAKLAEIYLSNDLREKAEKTFAQAVAAEKKFRNPETVLPEMYMTWANALARYDLTKGKKVLLEGMIEADKNSFGSKERLEYMYGMISFYRQFGMKVEEQNQIKLLDEQLRALEKAKGLQEGDYAALGAVLVQMSDLFCLPPPRYLEKEEHTTIVGEGVKLTSMSVHASDYRKAEAYQKRAIIQFDKLSKDRRIAAHIALRRWYQYFGENGKAENEARTLDQISEGVDWRMLDGPKRGCSGACGMG